jgi:hypothetical protein
MRSRAALIALLIGLAAGLAMGGPALADTGVGGVGATPLAKKPAMRTAPPAPSAARPKTLKPLRLPAALAPKASPIPQDTGQCRVSCAQAYYFCLAGDDADTCSGPWTSCLAACSRGAAGP